MDNETIQKAAETTRSAGAVAEDSPGTARCMRGRCASAACRYFVLRFVAKSRNDSTVLCKFPSLPLHGVFVPEGDHVVWVALCDRHAAEGRLNPSRPGSRKEISFNEFAVAEVMAT